MVHVNLMQPVFDCKNITIGLYGLEDVFFKKQKSSGSGKNRRTKTVTYKNKAEIVSMVFPLYNFMDGPPRPGQMSYPFVLKIPDWLPASMLMTGHWEDRMSV